MVEGGCQANIEAMSITDETSHPEMSWWKEAARANIAALSVIDETSHPEMSWS
jgi:hypothetical protein